MKIDKVMYSVFAYIYFYEDYMKKKYDKKKKIYISKKDNKVLKNIYNTFNMKTVWIFSDFKKACRKIAVNFNKNIIDSAFLLVKAIKK